MCQTLAESIRVHRLEEHAESILRWARPCIHLCRHRDAPGALAPSQSRLGGAPHLPESLEWPEGRSGPMILIAQVRLSDVSVHDRTGMLPTSGLLYFWYDVSWQPSGFDPADRAGFRVQFVPDETTRLVERSFPGDPDHPKSWQEPSSWMSGPCQRGGYGNPPGGAFEPCSVTFAPGVSLPGWEWLIAAAPGGAGFAESEAYAELVRSLSPEDSPAHQLLGHPDLIQNPMEEECQLASNGVYCGRPVHGPRINALRAGAPDWKLLLQIDTDEEGPGWMWGDVGMIYYWIREQDLRRADFTNVWLVLQCT